MLRPHPDDAAHFAGCNAAKHQRGAPCLCTNGCSRPPLPITVPRILSQGCMLRQGCGTGKVHQHDGPS
eukprot:363171-Chlamydomonas_euryale.AAC.14